MIEITDQTAIWIEKYLQEEPLENLSETRKVFILNAIHELREKLEKWIPGDNRPNDWYLGRICFITLSDNLDDTLKVVVVKNVSGESTEPSYLFSRLKGHEDDLDITERVKWWRLE